MNSTADPTVVGSMGGSVVLPDRLIHEDEEIVLALKPSGFFVVLVSAPFIFAAAALAAGSYALDSVQVVSLSLNIIYALCLAASLVRMSIACIQWLSRVYVLTNRRVLRVKGVLRVSVFECALARVQNTVLALPLGERLFGMGTIQFSTAGTGLMEAAWTMISKPSEIHEIVVEYVRRAQERAGECGVA